MSKDPIIVKFEQEQMKKDIPNFAVGDTIRIHTKIVEEGGKERLQAFQGTVIARDGSGASETFTLHRIAYGEGMERVVLLHSPLLVKIEHIRHGKVRRAKLNYLKGSSGKAAKVKSRFVSATKEEATAA